MTRVLVLSDLWVPFPGGAERLAFNLARVLARSGDDVHVFTGYHPARQFDGPPFEFLEVPENDTGGLTLEAAIESHGADVLLVHHYWALKFERFITRPGVPIVQIVLNGRRLDDAAFAVYISDYVRDAVGNFHASDDLVMTPPAFDDVYAGAHGDAIGFVKPIQHKGVDLVYALARAMPDRPFLILRGEWQDIEVIERLPNVEFLEPVVDMREFYARVRLVLMPSISEDAGTVAQECALNEVPCISTDVGGLRETNRGGVLMPTRDVAAWAREITAALDHPERYDAIVHSQLARTPMADATKLRRFVERVHAVAR